MTSKLVGRLVAAQLESQFVCPECAAEVWKVTNCARPGPLPSRLNAWCSECGYPASDFHGEVEWILTDAELQTGIRELDDQRVDIRNSVWHHPKFFWARIYV